MGPFGGQLVVVLMILQAGAISGRIPIPPTTCTTEETTTVTPPPTTTTADLTTMPECPAVDCYLTDCRTVHGSHGCLECDCSPYNCDTVTCEPGQECVMQEVECPYPWCVPEPACVSQSSSATPETTTHGITGTTTETTTETTTATITCPPIPQFSDFPAGCGRFLDSDGCYRYRCYTCDDVQCGEDGTCELQTCYDFPCTHPWLCISATGRTTETTTETTTSSCPPIPPYARLPGCGAYEDPDGCMRVHCYTCDDISCDEGTTCELQTCYENPCPPPVICVSTTTGVPPTPTPPPTRTPTPSCPPPPPIPHYPGCGVYEGPDGCIRAECHTCDEISCYEGTTCELQTCYEYPCPPPVICVSTTVTDTSTETTTFFPCPPILPFDGIPGCSAFVDSRGCMGVICSTCDDILCDEGTTCELQTCYLNDFPCPPPVKCVSTTTGTSTEMTTPVCEDMSWCTCYLDFSSGGCPQCYCVDPVCGFLVRCGPDEDCLPSPGSEYGYACFSIYGTTTPLCEDLSWCTGSCGLDYSSGGCPTCLCVDPICGWLIICGPDEDCLPSPDSEYGFACFSINGTTTETTPGTTSTECPIVMCSPNCVLSATPGPDGCPSTCECYPNCWDTPCDPGQECVFQFQCPPCFSLATCVPINDTTSVTPTPTPTDSTLITPTKHICPMPLCLRECPPVEGPDGCLKCVCSDFNCQNLTCGPGEECVMQEVDCPSDHPPCPPQPICVQATTTPCPQIKCARDCVSETGSDGCSFCTCPPSCNTVKCSSGHECQLVNVTCIRDPCFPQAQCVPVQETTTSCPMYKCAPDCVPDTGSDGCPICACPPTCETVRCSDGHECQLVNVTCFRYPCFPEPQCVPVEDPCTGTPNPGRCGRGYRTRWTYNSLTDTCESFRYYGCTPSPNTFRSRKECRNKCTGNSQIICPTFVCEDNCYTLERKNKCRKCLCPNPCEGFRCRKGYECKMREAKCDKEPKPFCAKIADPCPTQDPCGIRCMYGLKTDKNGCQLCECLKEPRSYNSTRSGSSD